MAFSTWVQLNYRKGSNRFWVGALSLQPRVNSINLRHSLTCINLCVRRILRDISLWIPLWIGLLLPQPPYFRLTEVVIPGLDILIFQMHPCLIHQDLLPHQFRSLNIWFWRICRHSRFQSLELCVSSNRVINKSVHEMTLSSALRIRAEALSF